MNSLYDLLEIAKKNGEELIEDISEGHDDYKIINDVYEIYFDIYRITRKSFNKELEIIGLFLLYVLNTIFYGPNHVNNITDMMLNYFEDIMEDDDYNNEYLNLYDSDGNRLRIDDVLKELD